MSRRMAKFTTGNRVRIGEQGRRSFSRMECARVGTVKGVSSDGLVIIRWDGLKTDDRWHPDLLERTRAPRAKP